MEELEHCYILKASIAEETEVSDKWEEGMKLDYVLEASVVEEMKVCGMWE
jgi:hypothetical protein